MEIRRVAPAIFLQYFETNMGIPARSAGKFIRGVLQTYENPARSAGESFGS
jgi:hypothetical protein